MVQMQGRKSETSGVRTSLLLENVFEVDEVSLFPLRLDSFFKF
jgi:hypothetical protein